MDVCIQSSVQKQWTWASHPDCVLPTELQMRLNQNIMVLHLEETHEIDIVLILLIYKPRWGLSQQSLGSSASQNTVTSGILHWEIMLCDPGGNGWWRSQHWDVSCPLFFFYFFYCIFPLFSLAWLVRFTQCAPSISPPCMWVAVDPLLFLAFISHLSFMIPSIIETSQPPLLPTLLKPNPKPSPGPGTPAPTTGVELCMVGSSETEDSPQPRPWPT